MKVKLKPDQVVGYVAVFLQVLILIGFFFGYDGFVSIILLGVLFVIYHKPLIKKEEFTKGEWMAIGILFIFLFLFWIGLSLFFGSMGPATT